MKIKKTANNWISDFKKITNTVSWGLNLIGMTILVAMMLLTTADVFMRYVFNSPWEGTFETTQFMLAVIVFYGLGYCASLGGHISIDIITRKLSPKIQTYNKTFNSFLSLALFSIITWQLFVYGMRLSSVGTRGPMTHIPLFIIVHMIAIGGAVCCLVMLAEFIFNCKEVMRK